eukprot:GEMP01037394.1.p1 GENE.GEMP01037394.1~~GEMP01037394.1.p1  ORF type:complete len:276 (+),score=64.12 GEMP01037394.1:99-926(+)
MGCCEGTISQRSFPYFGFCPPSASQICGRWPYSHIILRAVALLYIVALHIWRMSTSGEYGGAKYVRRYFLYATEWGLFCSLVYFTLVNAFLVVAPRGQLAALRCAQLIDGIFPHKDHDARIPKLLRASSAVLLAAIALEITVSVMFWISMTYSPGARKQMENPDLLAYNIQTHSVVCVLVCADFVFTGVPIFVIDVALVFGVYAAFLVVNLTYTLSSGSHVYDYLTWKDGKSFAVAAGGTVVFALWTGLMLLADKYWRQHRCHSAKGAALRPPEV